MAESKRISDLSGAGTLDGTELIELEQAGVSVQSSLLAINRVTPRVEWIAKTANGYGSTNISIPRYTTVVTNSNPNSDFTAVDSATLGTYITINTAGFYTVSVAGSFASASTLGISKNSANLSTDIFYLTVPEVVALGSILTVDYPITVTRRVWLAVNDVIRPHGDGSAVGAQSQHWSFSITKG